MKNIAIIPARSGSKGIVNKNIRPIAGVPAMAYTIHAALDSGMFDTVMVSTDSEEYADIARQYGAEVPFLRSSETSGDRASSWSVMREVLDRYKELGKEFETFALLQVTSPLRTGEDIREAFRQKKEKNANAVISVCKTDTPIAYCLPLPEDLSLKNMYDTRKYKPRQIYGDTYHANGAIYLYDVDAFYSQETIYDGSVYAFIMGRLHSVDVDDLEDFQIAEALVKDLPEYQRYFV